MNPPACRRVWLEGVVPVLSWLVLVPLFSCCAFLRRLNQGHPPSLPSSPPPTVCTTLYYYVLVCTTIYLYVPLCTICTTCTRTSTSTATATPVICATPATHRKAFTQRISEKHLHTQQAFRQNRFYAQQAFTHEAFTYSKPLHREAFTNSRLSHTASIYTQQAFTHKSFYSHTQKLWPGGLPKAISVQIYNLRKLSNQTWHVMQIRKMMSNHSVWSYKYQYF